MAVIILEICFNMTLLKNIYMNCLFLSFHTTVNCCKKKKNSLHVLSKVLIPNFLIVFVKFFGCLQCVFKFKFELFQKSDFYIFNYPLTKERSIFLTL